MCAKPARSETHGQGTWPFSRDCGERTAMVRVKNVLMMTFPNGGSPSNSGKSQIWS